MNTRQARLELQYALLEWRDSGAPVDDIADCIEGLIAVKVDEILQAREDNRAVLGQVK